MRPAFEPQTRVPGATYRVDPDTMLPEFDEKNRLLWNMPVPTQYVEHTNRRKHKRTGAVIEEPVLVPVYRGTSASYARYVKAQLRRTQRKHLEKQKADLEAKATEEKDVQETEDALTNLVLNPGGHNGSE